MKRPIGRSARPGRPSRRRGWLARRLGGVVMMTLAVSLIITAALYLRLSRGPVSLGPASQIIVDQLNAGAGGPALQASDVVFALGVDGAPSGLRLIDAKLIDPSGAVTAAAPDVGVKFRLSDALAGDAAPTAVRLDGASATVRRGADGRFSISFGGMTQDALGADGAGAEASVARAMLDGVDQGPLRRLRMIEVVGLDLTYEDAMTGRRITAQDAVLSLERPDGQARRVVARLSAMFDLGGRAPVRLTIEGDRALDRDATDLTVEFSAVSPVDLATQFSALAAFDVVDAPLSGRITASLGDDGQVRRLSGDLRAGAGAIRLSDDAPRALQAAEARFAYALQDRRIAVEHLRVESDLADGTAFGEVILPDQRAGDPARIDLTLSDLRIAPEGVFAAPLRFDRGALHARYDPAFGVLTVTRANVSNDAIAFAAMGEAARTPEGWRVALEARSDGFATSDLLSYWPVDVGPASRTWVEDHISGGRARDVVISSAFGSVAPAFSLEFGFDDVTGVYATGMIPITRAAGRGRVDRASFGLTLDAGELALADQRVIDVSGSTFDIPRFAPSGAQAETVIRAAGEAGDILEFIDTKPLRLLNPVDADLRGRLRAASGAATVQAALSFPLNAKELIARMTVDVDATVHDAAMTLGDDVDATSAALTVRATRDRFDLSGPAVIAGAAGELRFVRSAAGAADLTFAGRLDDRLLRSFGVAAARIDEGSAPFTVSFADAAAGTLMISLDLSGAAVSIPAMGWSKPSEKAGALRFVINPTDPTRISALRLLAHNARLSGDLILDGEGLRAARFDELAIGRRTDIAMTLETRPGGGHLIAATGPALDLDWLNRLASRQEGASSAPVEMSVDVTLLHLSKSLRLRDASGAIVAADGAVSADLSGRINGGSPGQISYNRPAGGGDATLIMSAENAGRALRDTGYFLDGHGGSLALNARLPGGEVDRAQGALNIKGMTVRDAPSLARMLSVASLVGLVEELRSGGIRFGEIRAPFRLEGEAVRLDNVIATGASLGLKLDGDYDGARDELALEGVLSPIYVVNGALSDVPLIGNILGGEGEGLFAFTFSVQGSAGAPAVSINPFSVLTPGALRDIFRPSGEPGAAPSRDFTIEKVDR